MTNIQSLINRLVYRYQYHNEIPTLDLMKDLEEMIDHVSDNLSTDAFEEIKELLQ